MCSAEKQKSKGKSHQQPPRRDAGRARGEPVLEAVLAATLSELAEKGYDKLSIERVARLAEVNKTSVYRRWPTREALVAAALERVLDEVNTELVDTGSLRGDLRLCALSVARLFETTPGRALAQAAFSAADAPELAAMARRRIATEAAGPVAEMVQRAIVRGEWRPEADPQGVLSMLAGAILHRSLLERQPVAGPWLELIIDVLVRGLENPKTSG
jgi:AcrR family transcriptional regulator